MSIKVKVYAVEGSELPRLATEGSSGFDLKAFRFLKLYRNQEEVPLERVKNSIDQGYLILRSYERVLIGTGLIMEIPKGYEVQIRPRSGNALKKGITVLNTPGTIDSDYRNEIGVIIYNSTSSTVKIEIGERIAQGVLMKVEEPEFIISLKKGLSLTDRGEGGFGSTDNKEEYMKIK